MTFPSGTVTFLFTDIEGSTKLAQGYPDKWESLRERHHTILRSAMDAHNGHVFQIIGDAFCVAFHTATDALNAAIETQRKLQTEDWDNSPIKVRIGIHTGEAELQTKGDYHGYLTMSLVQRIMSAGHGGQILGSNTTENLLHGQLPVDVTLRDMGEHRFKNVLHPVRVFQPVTPGLQSDFPPIRTVDNLPNNLPTQLNSFVGREKELADVKKLLQNSHLLTLIGPGGSGKTRLSIQLASESLSNYGDGVWLVELAPILDPLLVPRTIAIAIGLREDHQQAVMNVLCDYLHEKKILLVLDNCEHLVDACAQAVYKILKSAPHVRILASSREALTVAGEVTYRVPSLGLPDINHLPPVESLCQFEATKLFIDRATSALPSFAVTNDNAPFLAQICHRLDGIPLAIELAAAKIRMLNLEQIARRLDDRFRLLTGGSRTAIEHHQTLRATIDWSYNLLPLNEQILFRRLSVFVGGWTLEAAEIVCPDDSIESEDVLELMEHLVNKSIVVTEDTQQEPRYKMLETIRQYAKEKLLESGENVLLQNKHMEYFGQWINRIETALRGSDQVVLLESLEAELDNIRAALGWSLKQDVHTGLKMAGALKWFWHLRNHWSEGADWLDKFLSSDTTDTQPQTSSNSNGPARAKALATLAYLAGAMGELVKSTRSFEECVSLCQALDEKTSAPFLADCYMYMGVGALMDGKIDLTQILAEKSIELSHRSGSKFGVAEVQVNILMVLALRSGDFEAARRLNESNLSIRRELGDKDGIAYALYNGGIEAVCQGDYERAEMLLLEAVDASREARSDYVLGGSFGSLGLVHLSIGELDIAREYMTRLAKLAQEKWNPLHKAICICLLALYSFERGNFEKFTQLYGFLENETPLVIYLYYLFFLQTILQKNSAYAAEKLGEQYFLRIKADGKAMTLNQALAYALADLDD